MDRVRDGGRGRARAFTLVELLVVLAVIGILLALVLPEFERARRRGRAVACLAQLRQWGAFWGAYLADHQGWYSEGMENEAGVGVGWHRGEWSTVLERYYLNKTGLLLCPEARVPRSENGKEVDYGGPRATFKFGSSAIGRSSYGMNCWLYNPPPNVGSIQGRPSAYHWRRMGAVTSPTKVPIMLDAMWRGGGPDHAKALSIEPPAFNGEWKNYDAEMRHFAMDRHLGAVQAVFVDQSARRVPVRRLWKLKWHNSFNPDAVYS